MTIYFYLKKKEQNIEQPIICRIQNGMKVIDGQQKPDLATITTDIFITTEQWDKKSQRVLGKSVDTKVKNQNLVSIEEELQSIERSLSFLRNGVTAELIKKSFLGKAENGSEGNSRVSRTLLNVLNDYVAGMENGSILKKSGRRYQERTISGWKGLQSKVELFSREYDIPDFNRHNFDYYNTTELKKELTKYYVTFYNNLKNFMLEKGNRDNTIHTYTVRLRTIFNYVQKKEFVNLGNVQSEFFCSSDEFDVVALPEEVFFSVIKNYDKYRMMIMKRKFQLAALDYFILAGTVALRKSDMLNLSINRLHKKDGIYILSTTTKKTDTPIQFPLPEFLTNIIDRNLLQYKRPFPKISNSTLNLSMKRLCSKISDFYMEIEKVRVINGEKKLLGRYPLHELVCPHMLRRTAVSNMLSAGVPVNIIKAVGGWKPGSKTFEERYLAYNQTFSNQKIKMYYERIDSFVNGKVA